MVDIALLFFRGSTRAGRFPPAKSLVMPVCDSLALGLCAFLFLFFLSCWRFGRSPSVRGMCLQRYLYSGGWGGKIRYPNSQRSTVEQFRIPRVIQFELATLGAAWTGCPTPFVNSIENSSTPIDPRRIGPNPLSSSHMKRIKKDRNNIEVGNISQNLFKHEKKNGHTHIVNIFLVLWKVRLYHAGHERPLSRPKIESS